MSARSRRLVGSSLGALIILAVAAYLPLTLLSPVQLVSQSTADFAKPTPTAAALVWPKFGAAGVGAVGFPAASKSAGDTKPQSIASITKIITCLVVLQKMPITGNDVGPVITFSADDVALKAKYDALQGETKPIIAGRTITERDLMSVALIASANNYAAALANWAYGSQEEFVSATAAWLTVQGLGDTTILEPTGINPANKSTPRDLVKIGMMALQNTTIASIIALPSFTLSGLGTITNTNSLLGNEGIDGIKTGTLKGVGSDLLFSATYPVGEKNIIIVGVIVGAPNRVTLNLAVRELLASVKAGFHLLSLTTAGQKFSNYRTGWNDRASAVALTSNSIVVWSNPAVTVTVDATPLRSARQGAAVGSVRFTIGDSIISVPLRLDRTLGEPSILWRLTNPAALFG